MRSRTWPFELVILRCEKEFDGEIPLTEWLRTRARPWVRRRLWRSCFAVRNLEWPFRPMFLNKYFLSSKEKRFATHTNKKKNFLWEDWFILFLFPIFSYSFSNIKFFVAVRSHVLKQKILCCHLAPLKIDWVLEAILSLTYKKVFWKK